MMLNWFTLFLILFSFSCAERPEHVHEASLHSARSSLGADGSRALLEREWERAEQESLRIEALEAQKNIQNKINNQPPTGRLIRQPVEEKAFSQLLGEAPRTLKNQPKNIILFFVDTLRDDYVNQKVAPNMREFIDQNWHFTNPYSSSTITLKSSFSLFYSQPAHLRETYVKRDWKNGSPFLQSMKALGYNIKLFGSPWQYCLNTPPLHENYSSLTSALSNIRLLYGAKPNSLLSSCYDYFDYDPKNLLRRRNPETYPQAFPNIGIKAESWKTYRGDLNEHDGKDAKKWKYSHQGYLDYKIVEDALSEIGVDNIPGNQEKNLYFIYLFGVHEAAGWPDRGIPKDVMNPSTTFDAGGEFAPFAARIKDILSWGGPLPSLHTPLYWEVGGLLRETKTKGNIADLNLLKIQLEGLYHNGVVGADYEFSRLVEMLKANNLYDDALIILVSDHGKLIFEPNLHTFISDDREKYDHCCTPYKQNSNVPLAIKFPQSQDERIKDKSKNKMKLGSHLDIFPSVVDYIAPNYYQALKKNNMVAGHSLLERERSCSVTVMPGGGRDSQFVFNNGNFKAWIRADLDPKVPELQVQKYWIHAFLTMDDKLATYGNRQPQNMSMQEQQKILDENFRQCLDEMFPYQDLTWAYNQNLKYNLWNNLNNINMLGAFRYKTQALADFTGEQVKQAFDSYQFLDSQAYQKVAEYFKPLSYNPKDPLSDFKEVDVKQDLSSCGAEPAYKISDSEERPPIYSEMHEILEKGEDEQHYYYNNAYFEANNYNNLPPTYFSKLKLNERMVGFGFVGNRGGATKDEADRRHMSVLYYGLPSGGGNNIDIFSYFGGHEKGTLNGFRSFSRSPIVAKHFASVYGEQSFKDKVPGYVYVAYLEGGILDISEKAKMSAWSKTGKKTVAEANVITSNDPNLPIFSLFSEQEIVLKSSTPPHFIMAFRAMSPERVRKGAGKGDMVNGKFDAKAPIYVRKGLEQADPKAYERIIKALAGCKTF